MLCTKDKTYNLRQVNTSNSLFVTQASDGTQDEPPHPRLQAIAQSQVTLEVLPAKNVSVAERMKTRLPVYASTGHYQSADPISKSKLFEDIPASYAECELAWKELACFELNDEALIPSMSVKLKAWESMLTAANADGLDLTQEMRGELYLNLRECTEWPADVGDAILASMVRGELRGAVEVDEIKCATMVGRALLTDWARDSMPKAAFLKAWADLLPEGWRGNAKLSLLDGWYKLDNGDIMLADETATAPMGAKAPAEGKSTLGAKRKWHEKFRGSVKKTS